MVFKAKRTRSIVRKLFSKRSEHLRQLENYFLSEANTFDRKNIVFKAKRTRSTVGKMKRSEPVSFKNFKIEASEEN